MAQKQTHKTFAEQKAYEEYLKQHPKKEWNFPFKYAFEKLFGKAK